MEPVTTTRVAVKLSLTGETHRVTLEHDELSFDALCALVPQTFAQATPKTWALVYTDNEGDLVTVSTAAEFSEARHVFLELNSERKTMHFRVLPRVSVKDQIPPAVLQAVDELSSTIARLASGTRESLSQSTYLERGRASVVYSAKQTREFLESARKEIAQRLKDVQARIVGEIERRRSSASSADEEAASMVGASAAMPSPSLEETRESNHSIEMETRHSHQVVEDDSDDEEEADDEKDSDDEDDEAEDKREESFAPLPLAAAVEAVLQAVEAPREAEAEVEATAAAVAVETPYESDAETVASSSSDEDDDSDRDWDVVPDVWNAEVALIRNILPHVHAEDCVEMLRKHNGSLEAAINELTDA